jgi:hypothetical protein
MSVELAKDGAGNYAIGATIDGVFVPFATVASHRVGHLSERAAILDERASDPTSEGYGAAVDAKESGFQVVKSASSSSSSGHGSKTKAELLDIAADYGLDDVSSSSTKAELLDAIEAHESEGGSE